MIRYSVGLISRNTNHPVLAGLLILAGIILLLGAIVEFGLGENQIGGWLAVYAVITAFMGFVGYFILFSVKFGRKAYREIDLT